MTNEYSTDNYSTNLRWFRHRLFDHFCYRAGATMDLIDAVAATPVDSVVKLSLSPLFRRTYSSLTDVLGTMFRRNLKTPPTTEDTRKETSAMTCFLALEVVPQLGECKFAMFAIDCTANPRIYATKVNDRTIVHAPNHVPGQLPITVGHEYSVIAYLPNGAEEIKLHWLVPLSVQRVRSDQTGPEVGLLQLEEVVNQTLFKYHFCVNVADAAYSTREWVIKVNQMPNVVHIARMRGNRKVYRKPPSNGVTKRGRPQIYGAELLLQDPSQPDLEEVTTITSCKGRDRTTVLQRWNDVIIGGSKEERTHEYPCDILRVTVTDSKGKPVYRRPLWVMIVGAKRREISSKEAYIAYGRRYDIEHFFRFGKQKLGLVSSQTCETRHEECWQWIGLLAYNMLYHARKLTKSESYPWEKKKVRALTTETPSQVQRDYGHFILKMGTPAPEPKPRGKPTGRQKGQKTGGRLNCPLIRKSTQNEDGVLGRPPSALSRRRPRHSYERYLRMKRIWPKDRPPPKRC